MEQSEKVMLSLQYLRELRDINGIDGPTRTKIAQSILSTCATIETQLEINPPSNDQNQKPSTYVSKYRLLSHLAVEGEDVNYIRYVQAAYAVEDIDKFIKANRGWMATADNCIAGCFPEVMKTRWMSPAGIDYNIKTRDGIPGIILLIYNKDDERFERMISIARAIGIKVIVFTTSQVPDEVSNGKTS